MRVFRQVAAFALMALTLASCTYSPPMSTDGKCVLTKLVSFPIEISHDRILVPVMINGSADKFVLSTGSDVTFLSRRIADQDKLVLHRTMDVARQNGQDVRIYNTSIDFSVGGIAASHMKISVMDNSNSPMDPYAAGVLANPLTKRFDTEIDLARSQISLYSQDHCPGVAAGILPPPILSAEIFGSEGGLTLIPISVGGLNQYALLETDSPHTWMDWDAATGLGITPATPGVTYDSSIDDGVIKKGGYRYILPEITIGAETLKNFPIDIVDDSRQNGASRYGRVELGFDFFKKNRVYIATMENKIYFSPYGYPASPGAAHVP